MYYHLNRAMFYHQLLSAVETEISKKDLAYSPLSGEQEASSGIPRNSGAETNAPNPTTVKAHEKQHTIGL